MKLLSTPERRICVVIETKTVAHMCRGKVVKEDKEVTERRAFFHLFAVEAMPLEPSPLQGGRPGGQYSKVLAIVEYEDGTVDTVNPESVRFLDTAGLMAQYSWGEKPERDCLTCEYNENGINRPCRDCKDFDKWEAPTQ